MPSQDYYDLIALRDALSETVRAWPHTKGVDAEVASEIDAWEAMEAWARLKGYL